MTSTRHQGQNWRALCSFRSLPGLLLSIVEFLCVRTCVWGGVSEGHLLLLPCILGAEAKVALASSELPTSKLPLRVCNGAGLQQRARQAPEPSGSSVSPALNLPPPRLAPRGWGQSA